MLVHTLHITKNLLLMIFGVWKWSSGEHHETEHVPRDGEDRSSCGWRFTLHQQPVLQIWKETIARQAGREGGIPAAADCSWEKRNGENSRIGGQRGLPTLQATGVDRSSSTRSHLNRGATRGFARQVRRYIHFVMSFTSILCSFKHGLQLQQFLSLCSWVWWSFHAEPYLQVVD